MNRFYDVPGRTTRTGPSAEFRNSCLREITMPNPLFIA
jgi:hypothetical protein